MKDRIQVSKQDAKWYSLWRKRLDSNTPKEGDYNFVMFKAGGEVVYEPPTDGSNPSVFTNGEWVELETKNN